MKKTILIGLTLSLLGFVAAPNARADEWNKKTILTFSQPVEIPGHVLPAGTYTFKLADSMSDRHIVQVFNADGSQIIATIIAIPDYRLKVTGETVIKFTEVPAGQPEAVRAWFYPGNSVGQEFVYPKRRAIELAQMTKAVVPALATDTDDAEALKTAPIVAVTPEEKEMPVAAAIQTTPENTTNETPSMSGMKTTGTSARRDARELPKTASTLPLVLLFGFVSIGVALGLMVFGKRSTTPTV